MVCEGYEDVQFFKYLIEARNIQPFRVIDTSNKPHDRQGGISKFKTAINAQKQDRRWFESLTDIVLVADNDDTPDKNFNIVADQVERLFGVRPHRALVPVGQKPRVTILMLPWPGEPGNLECLCQAPARRADKVTASHVDYFMASIRHDRWLSECRKGKAWLRSNLAGRCSDPFVTLGTAFTDYRDLFDLRDRSIDRIADFLAKV